MKKWQLYGFLMMLGLGIILLIFQIFNWFYEFSPNVHYFIVIPFIYISVSLFFLIIYRDKPLFEISNNFTGSIFTFLGIGIITAGLVGLVLDFNMFSFAFLFLSSYVPLFLGILFSRESKQEKTSDS